MGDVGFGGEFSHAENEAEDESGEGSLGVDSFPKEAEEEDGGDRWGEVALDRLEVFVDAASGHAFHDGNPDDAADDDDSGGDAADFDEVLLALSGA